jgi:hypothetical protein
VIKKFLIGVLILISVYTAILIFFGDDHSINPPPQPSLQTEKPNSPLKNPITAEPSAQNFDESARVKGGGITQQNLESSINQYFENEIKKFDANSLKPIISSKNLKIINDLSKEAVENYIKNLNAVYKDLINIDQKILIKNSSLEIPINFNVAINAYQKIIDSLYKIAVPQNLNFVHQEQIALLSAQRNAFKIVKDYEKDPMKAMLAMEAGEKFSQDFISLTETFNQLLTSQ